MLLQAAAAEWKVEKSTCRTDSGIIYHDASKRNLTYGTVAKAASKLPVRRMYRSRIRQNTALSENPRSGWTHPTKSMAARNLASMSSSLRCSMR